MRCCCRCRSVVLWLGDARVQVGGVGSKQAGVVTATTAPGESFQGPAKEVRTRTKEYGVAWKCSILQEGAAASHPNITFCSITSSFILPISSVALYSFEIPPSDSLFLPLLANIDALRKSRLPGDDRHHCRHLGKRSIWVPRLAMLSQCSLKDKRFSRRLCINISNYICSKKIVLCFKPPVLLVTVSGKG